MTGKTDSVTIYELLGRAQAGSEQRGWIDAFKAGFDAFRVVKFSNSADFMNRACQLRGGSDGSAEFYLRNIVILQSRNLQNWDGIIELSEK